MPELYRNMRTWISAMLLFFAMGVAAQSSMTDEQVMEYIVRENAAGTSQQQMTVKLMQRGVDISQIRRIKSRYERQLKQNGLGQVSDKTLSDNSRLRTNNGKSKSSYKEVGGKAYDSETGRVVKNDNNDGGYRLLQYRDYENLGDDDEEMLLMQREMEDILPTDTAALVEKLQAALERKQNKVFGRDIFNNKALTFEPAMNIATPQNYRLGPGDAVIIDIYGASQKSLQSSVTPDGDIIVEGFGPVQVSGLTIAQANARLRSQIGARYQSSKVRLTLGQTRTITINVMGEVNAPGTYTLSAFASVFHALYMAGGTNELGTLRNIKVYRGGRLVSVVDIYDYILNGKLTGNVRLADNDVIVVGPYDCLVNIVGKVKRPMYYEMKKNESVGSLLKYAGGFTGDAYTKSLRVERQTGREHAVFNIGEFDMSGFRVTDGDKVTVDSILDRYENTVEVKGEVFRPGKYQIGGEITTVRSLLEHAEGLTEDAFTARAVMHRMKEDRSLQVIALDVAGIMSGKVPDVPLRENDVLFVPTRQDRMQQQTITIHGEVMYPGVYQYAEGETLEDFVLQAGGLTNKASTVKVNVSRRLMNPKALAEDSVIAKTFTMDLKDGFIINGEPGFVLQPFDEVYVRKSPGYSEQKNVSIGGEIMFAGNYTLTKRNSRLSDLVKLAGGPTELAYIKGARLERRTNEVERKRMEAVLKMAKEEQEKNLLELATASNNAGALSSIAQNTQKDQLAKYNIPEYYPVGIELDRAIENPGCDADLVLREGDRLVLPRYEATVKINGAVMYPNSVAYQRGKSAKYYINAAGGFADNARKSHAYIIYMNGMVAQIGHNADVEPGCEIVVPAKIKTRMTTAERLAMGTSGASMAAVIASIVNLLK